MKKQNSASLRNAVLGNINILVLDHDPRMLTIIKNVLTDLGFHNVFMGRDGREGLDLMEQRRIHLVITDWDMRPINGIDFVNLIRNIPDPQYRMVPVIMLTARAEVENVIAARDAGMTEFVAKPFTVKRLVDRIIAVVDNPRSFILANSYKGHDRRRHEGAASGYQEKRKKRKQP
jgi:DNA-binding response OmpR family regulator